MRRLLPVALAAALALLTVAAAQPATSTPGNHLILVLDVSARMAESTADGATRVQAMQWGAEALLRLFALTRPIPRVGVVTFSDEADPILQPSNNMDTAAAALDGLPAQAGGGADVGAALQVARSLLEGVERGVIVLVSAGPPTQGLTASQVVEGPARAAGAEGHCFYTVSVGDAGAAFLERLRAVSPCPRADRTLVAENGVELARAFAAIAHAATGGEPGLYTERVAPGERARVDLRVPPNQAEVRVSVVAGSSGRTEGAPDVTLAGPNGVRPRALARAEARGAVALAASGPVEGPWSLTLRNNTDEMLTYEVVISTVPLPPGFADADTLISIAVAVVITLVVGVAVLAVERLWPRPAPADAVLVNLSTGAAYPLRASEDESTHIGSASDCTIVLPAAGAAPYHAVIRYGRGRYYLQDQANGGGVMLNNSPISATPLINGDRITIGGATFQFRQEARPRRLAR